MTNIRIHPIHRQFERNALALSVALMKFITTAAVALLAFNTHVAASELPDHYQGKPSLTLESALSNLTEYNRKLAKLVAQETLSPEDLNEVHILTYTLENALGKLGSEREQLAELLEQVHKASERADSDTVKTSGRAYLQGSAPLQR